MYMNGQNPNNREHGAPRGPQFNDETDVLRRIEQAKSTGWGEKFKAFVAAYRVQLLITVVVAAVIVVGLVAVNALAPDNEQPQTATTQQETSDSAATTKQPTDNTLESSDAVPQPTTNADGDTTEQAQRGEGITHLARRAIARYAESASTELSAEQRVYAEDYLQNRIGEFSLEVGDEITFAADDTAAAVTHAQALNQTQLQNLTQYATALNV
jgi:hypothetical protein